ncbi:hypothetical protein D3C71_273480 [compost metagenome]
MPRVMRCANHCSPVELMLLKSLRSIAHHNDFHPDSSVLLEKIGLGQYQAFFSSLIKWIKNEDAQFHFHQTESAFLSEDEMGLLALLAQASCKEKSPFSSVSSSSLHRSLNECGIILQQNKIKLRYRPGNSEIAPSVY